MQLGFQPQDLMQQNDLQVHDCAAAVLGMSLAMLVCVTLLPCQVAIAVCNTFKLGCQPRDARQSATCGRREAGTFAARLRPGDIQSMPSSLSPAKDKQQLCS